MQRHNTKPKDSPPLPQPYGYKLSSRTFGRIPLFTADQMRAYVLADRAARVERREAMAAEMVAAIERHRREHDSLLTLLAKSRQKIEDADGELRRGRQFMRHLLGQDTALAIVFNDILRALGTYEVDHEANARRERAAIDAATQSKDDSCA